MCDLRVPQRKLHPVEQVYDPVVERIAHWWNGSWGSLARKDVWLDRLDDGRFEIRWSGGDWGESSPAKREGCCWRRNPAGVIAALNSLLGDDLGAWRDLEAISRSLPPRDAQRT